MPRAGHHFVARLLQALFRDDLFYCEHYSETDCCQAVPCALRGIRRITYQKSHDFDVGLPTDIGDAIYLIQHRAPVPLLVSAREHLVQVVYSGPYGEAIGSHRGEYEVWLGRQAEYYAAFSRRWLRPPPANSVVLDYRDLAADPGDFLGRMAELVGIEVAPEQIDVAIAATIERAGRYGEDPYVRRSVETRPYVDRELLAVCESLLFAQDLGLTSGRVYDPVPFEGTLIWQVYEARRCWRAGDLSAALAVVDRAIASFPENGMLFHERAVLLQGLSRVVEARDALAQASALLPPHPQVLAAQVDVALTLGNVAAARAWAEALVALNPTEPLDHVVLALARSHRPDQHEGEQAAATPRLLEHELVQREIALRQSHERQAAAEAAMKELAAAADERLRDAEAAHAEAGQVREAYGRLSAQLEEKEREIADLRATADERLRMLEEQARAVDEKERLIQELAAAAEERLHLVKRLDAEARRAREAVARLTGGPPDGDHVIVRASPS